MISNLIEQKMMICSFQHLELVEQKYLQERSLVAIEKTDEFDVNLAERRIPASKDNRPRAKFL